MTVSVSKRMAAVSRLGRRFHRAKDGATAVEFGLIALPFFMMLFGILGVCQLFFWTFTAENAVWNASRDMRTGAFQTGSSSVYAPYYTNGTVTNPSGLINAFRNSICSGTVTPSDCNANSVVLVQSNANSSSITTPSCVDSNNSLLTTSNPLYAFSAGGANSVVIVTLCYNWAYGAKLLFLPVPKLNGGGYLIQASAAFRTEPYQ